jgi:hypothetical protein
VTRVAHSREWDERFASSVARMRLGGCVRRIDLLDEALQEIELKSMRAID